MRTILWILALVIVGFMVVALVVDFIHFNAVSEAQTPEEIKAACDWYDMRAISRIPAKCVRYYKINVGSDYQVSK